MEIIRADGTREPFKIAGQYPTLEEMQAAVGGYVEQIPMPDGRVMLMDEEGKLNYKPLNIIATAMVEEWLDPSDCVVGDVVVLEAGEMESEDQQ